MKKLIVIATDFSPAAAHAAAYAMMLARQLKADIRVCHATEASSSEDDSQTRLEEFAQTLAKNVEREDDDAGGNPVITLLNGKSGQAGRFSTSLSAYMVVIGTSGAGQQNKMWTGRGGENILRVTTSQVLLVPFGTVIRQPGKILFATMMEKKDQPVLTGLVGLAGDLRAEIIIAHIDKGSYDHESRKKQWLCFTETADHHLTGAPPLSYLNVPSHEPAAGLSDIIVQEGVGLLMVSRDIYAKLYSLLASGDLRSREMAGNLRIPLLVAAAVAR